MLHSIRFHQDGDAYVMMSFMRLKYDKNLDDLGMLRYLKRCIADFMLRIALLLFLICGRKVSCLSRKTLEDLVWLSQLIS